MRISSENAWWTQIPIEHPRLLGTNDTVTGASAKRADDFTISESAQRRIDDNVNGENSLKNTMRSSRAERRRFARERVKAARDYLLLLAQYSSPDDKHAAAEAARVSQEIRDAAREYNDSLKEDQKDAASSSPEALNEEHKLLIQFTASASTAVQIARGIIERYVKNRKVKTSDDSGFAKQIVEADEAIRKLSATGISADPQLTPSKKE
jgi:hypothetical protein